MLVCQEVNGVWQWWLSIQVIPKLVSALRTAVAKGEGKLDKEATSHDDLLDAFRLSLQYGVGD
jgi:hypothetical protein